ncbi:heme biosynthesis HemY N-terminal domain-containing protein [Methylococcus sp. EFPC2]|uniref:heme biosynthesis HemY N-terminal domain-containing protein n=1 Tax=Methylococcus sp. EFPC2 TaxID=2812648 RepID=UPI001967E3E9|nr:heme biosynthesis HemY N-terminal domain-containing protein [Methylococcus sp. EFPC2]QSA96375.1 heme biosynthesis protein HemY [Methylococcus sp. EFPC2]
MKRALILLAIFSIILAGAIFFIHRQLASQGDPGFFVAGIGNWKIETTLILAASAIILSFIALYVVIRIIANTLRLPRVIKQRVREKRGRLSQEALVAGLLASVEGNWENAEKHLIRHAANSGVPLINYLTAARAAHSRGALEQRDEYLRLAHESMPDAELAIGLTKAELQLSNQQFEEALENLTQLELIAPSHAAVLRLKHQAYAQAEDWEGLSHIIPQLHTNKILLEAEIKLLEAETYTALLKQRSEEGGAATLRKVWDTIPAHIREMSGIQQLYFAAMIEAGAGAEVETALRQALSKEWNSTLLVLYGCIQSFDAQQQLALAEESWLPSHARDAVLHRVLGKLALRVGDREKAAKYLDTSLGIEPSVEAYQLMGDLFLQQNDTPKASQYFRNGLLFASNEVVAQIEQYPQADLDSQEVAEAPAETEPAASSS